jgi:hypothetical protein
MTQTQRKAYKTYRLFLCVVYETKIYKDIQHAIPTSFPTGEDEVGYNK